MSFWEKIKLNIRALTYGEDSQSETTIEKQQKKVQLSEIERSLIVLVAEVIKASKSYPKQTEQKFQEFFNLHFGFLGTLSREKLLNENIKLGPRSHTKMSCTQIKALATQTSIEEMMQFLFDIATSDQFLNQQEKQVLKQISIYLGLSSQLFEQLCQRSLQAKSPYTILGIQEGSSFSTLLQAYRKKVLLYHPDTCQLNLSEQEMTRQFQLVKNAFDILSLELKEK